MECGMDLGMFQNHSHFVSTSACHQFSEGDHTDENRGHRRDRIEAEETTIRDFIAGRLELSYDRQTISGFRL
jgi:hypothetical protein